MFKPLISYLGKTLYSPFLHFNRAASSHIKLPWKPPHIDLYNQKPLPQSTLLNPQGPTTKKFRNIGLLLLLITTVLSSFLYAKEDNLLFPTDSKSVVFSPSEGLQWVKKCIDQYEEIQWLADINTRKTEEGQAKQEEMYSKQIFDQNYVEFDRTIMTIKCLKLILDGSDEAYETFVSAQKEDVRLSRESFQQLHVQGQRLLESKWGGLSQLQMAQAMETALVLGDMGKSKKARELFKSYGITDPDHDDFHEKALQILQTHPEICPSFARLSPSAKTLLIKSANLAHYGHITHLEGGVEMFRKLKESCILCRDPIAFSFDLFIHICDVAGALGHVNKQSSLVYTKFAHVAMQAVKEAIQVLSDPQKTPWDAYNAYLKIRASCLGLNPENKSDRVLTRIGAMLRLFTKEDGLLLKEAILKLETSIHNRVCTQLDLQEQDLDRTPTYMPAVLVNLSNNPQLGESREERLSKAAIIGLPFIAKVLEKHKELLKKNEIDPDIPLNFNNIAGITKTSPNLLLNREFYIDKEGGVYLLE